MKMQTGTDGNRRFLVAGALALISQGALSEEAEATARPHEELTVTAPRQETAIGSPTIEIDAAAIIEAMDRRVREDLERNLKPIRPARVELAISEVPARG